MKKQIDLWITNAGEGFSGPLLSLTKPDFTVRDATPCFDAGDNDVTECPVLNCLNLPDRFVGKIRVRLTEKQPRPKSGKGA
jgi:hypothetical protein